MPDKYKCDCSIQAYHNYYNGDNYYEDSRKYDGDTSAENKENDRLF